MPENQFSEFSFGFAFTQEVTFKCWSAIGGAPEMPSLFDEGHGKGFDVSVGLWGWTLLAQFKRGWRATRSTAREWPTYHAQYTRFEIYASKRSTQHQDLVKLEHASVTNWVAYVVPTFHTNTALSNHFLQRNVVDHVRMLSPTELAVNDGLAHHVTFRGLNDPPVVHSEPRTAEELSEAKLRRRLSEPLGRDTAEAADDGQTLDAAYFDAMFDRLLAVAEQRRGGNRVDGLLAGADSMSPFGRARIAARLLFGAELLALPAAGQAVG